jgi:Domain of unknown function (DUF4404)
MRRHPPQEITVHTSELKALLRRVQHEVEATPSLDASIKTQLAALDEAIQAALKRPSGDDADSQEPTLEDQALAIETKLAAVHPMLVNSMRQMIDSLGKMGI